MRRGDTRRVLGALFASVAWLTVAVSALPRQAQAQGVGDQPEAGVPRYIVVLKREAGDPAQAAPALARSYGLTPERIYRKVLPGFVVRLSQSRLAAVQQDPRVDYVEADRPFRAFATFPIPTGVDRIDADVSAAAKIDHVEDPLDVDIAIIDSGIQRDHPDLNVAGGRNFATSDESNDSFDDLNGHGTHVAGIAAARDDGPNQNGLHVVGVAPGARLWAVRAMDAEGSSWTSWVVAAVEWVTDTSKHPPIEVANMSLGGPDSQAVNEAVAASVASGITYVVAAGNDGQDCKSTSPANSTSSGVITVSALADYDGQGGGSVEFSTADGGDDTFATFSNYGTGSNGVDIAAPGVAILSTYPGGKYVRLSGTSMAAPHVAGAAALYVARHGGSPKDVKNALLNSAKPADSDAGYTGGSGDDVNEPVLYAGGF